MTNPKQATNINLKVKTYLQKDHELGLAYLRVDRVLINSAWCELRLLALGRRAVGFWQNGNFKNFLFKKFPETSENFRYPQFHTPDSTHHMAHSLNARSLTKV